MLSSSRRARSVERERSRRIESGDCERERELSRRFRAAEPAAEPADMKDPMKAPLPLLLPFIAASG